MTMPFTSRWLVVPLFLAGIARVCYGELNLNIPAGHMSETSPPAGETTNVVSGSGPAGEDPAGIDQAPWRMALDLVDGSLVIGEPIAESLRLSTEYADMDLAFTNISFVKLSKNTNVVSVSFLNGDELRGKLLIDAVGMKTAFGESLIKVEHITTLRMLSGGRALPADLREGLVLYYSFDRPRRGVVTDNSGNGNHGKAKGAKWVAAGVSGGAYEFAGEGGEITASDQQLPRGDSPRSVSLWFKFASPPAQNNGWFTCWGTEGQRNQCSIVGFDNRVNRFGVSFSQWGAVDVSKKKITAAGTWHHAVLVYKGGGATQFYIDTVDHGLQADEIGSRVSTVLSGQLTIGKGKFAGLMDEIMIYERALSKEDVEKIHGLQKRKRGE